MGNDNSAQMAQDMLDKFMASNENERKQYTENEARREAAMIAQLQNFMKDRERDRETTAKLLNAADNRHEKTMENERASARGVREMMEADKKSAVDRGDQRLKNVEIQRQNDIKLLNSKHKDTLDRESKGNEEVVKKMEGERDFARKRQKEIDLEHERNIVDERKRVQSLHEDRIKVMEDNQGYERDQSARQIKDNERKYERSREREVGLFRAIVYRTDDDRKRADERADRQRELDQSRNMEVLEMIVNDRKYERERNRVVQDNLFQLTAMQRLPLPDYASHPMHYAQGGGQLMGDQNAQPVSISSQSGHPPAQIGYQMSAPGQIGTPMQNVGQPAPVRGQIPQQMPVTGKIIQQTPVTGQIRQQIPVPGQIRQQTPVADQAVQQMSTAEHCQQCEPSPDQLEKRRTNEISTDVFTSYNHQTQQSASLGDHNQMFNPDLVTEAGKSHLPGGFERPDAEGGEQHLSALEKL